MHGADVVAMGVTLVGDAASDDRSYTPYFVGGIGFLLLLLAVQVLLSIRRSRRQAAAALAAPLAEEPTPAALPPEQPTVAESVHAPEPKPESKPEPEPLPVVARRDTWDRSDAFAEAGFPEEYDADPDAYADVDDLADAATAPPPVVTQLLQPAPKHARRGPFGG